MPDVQPIPFTANQESGADVLGGAGDVALNVIIDSKGTVRRRPGIEAYAESPATTIDSRGITGIHKTEDGSLIAMAGSSPGQYTVYFVTRAAAGTLGTFTGTNRPVFAETEAMLCWADGRALNRMLKDGKDTGRLDPGAPTATHVVAQSLRLLANEASIDRTNVNYSGVSSGSATIGHEEWNIGVGPSLSTSGFFSAEADPGPVVALAANSNEVVAFKGSLVQNFVPDSTSVYARVATREFGCSAPFSVVRDDQSFAWLDHRRRIVHSDLRSVNILSDAIQSTLDDLTVVEDCVGIRINHGPVDALVFIFPTDGRSFAYQKNGGWSQWMGWDAEHNVFSRWLVNAHFHVPGSHENLVGLTDGVIAQVRHDSPDDLGNVIPAYIQTGYINRGSNLRKHCRAVRLTFRRGVGAGSDTPVAGLSWRDDEGSWQGPLQISLGRSGDTAPVVSLRSLGTYRTRQWRLEFTGTEDFVLAGAEEEFEVLSQ